MSPEKLISDKAIKAAWDAYDKETWNGSSTEIMGEEHKNKCLRVAIETAAKIDGVDWKLSP